MSKARLVITALFAENETPPEVAGRYGVDRSWVYRLNARYAEGEAAFEPRARRPKTSPTATAPETVVLVLSRRKQLAEAGHDAGAETICWHLTQHRANTLSRATIHRIPAGHGQITPEPKKRPKSSYIRFAAEQPDETWQSDFTHYPLTDTATFAKGIEIITWLDDHSRYALHVSRTGSPRRSCSQRSARTRPRPHPRLPARPSHQEPHQEMTNEPTFP